MGGWENSFDRGGGPTIILLLIVGPAGELPPLKIQVDDIPPEGLDVVLSEKIEGMTGVLREFSEGRAVAPIEGQLQLLKVEGSDVVVTSGEVHTRVQRPCDRCLEPTILKVDSRIQGVLQPHSAASAGVAPGAEIEVKPEDLDVSWYGPEGIDVCDIVREQLMLSLPLSILCRPDCKGICQACGAELNIEPCRCDKAKVDPRFAILRQLKK